ncbi:hypothetical protein BGX34_010944 [Mortierella sp. NVP85]|nr:hypothetical protein BGX34_010944 [Mortierella sp. NVP85]
MSSPAISSAPPAPRAQRSKKSGPAHKQSQSQSTPSQSSSQPRPHAPRRTQRAPEQTHARHQSMPHQRSPTKPDMTNVTILKRSSAASPAAAAAKTAPSSPQATTAVSDKTLEHHKQKHQYQQHQQHQHQNYPNQKPRPQSQQQLPSKARRVQRRKDIEATTESLAQVDIDLALHQSPPLDPSSPPSSSDSDDSESALSPLPEIASRRRQLASNQPQRSTSAPTVPQLRRGHQEVDSKPHRGDVYPSRASLPMELQQRPMVHTKTNSADKVMLVEKKSPLYAGPTFHNSPAPTSLPIPVFARSAGNSPTEKTPAPFFGEAASPQLNSTRPLVTAPPTWNGHYSMPMSMNYNVPDRMATSSYPQLPTAPYNGDQLMEISQNLRMLLKIQSQ